MTLLEYDLLSALRELYEASKEMTSGELPTDEQLERHQQALSWAERVMARAEKG